MAFECNDIQAKLKRERTVMAEVELIQTRLAVIHLVNVPYLFLMADMHSRNRRQ
jgi:hypothetical protein